jgi:hypothetical protein
VDAPAGQGIQVGGQRRHEGLAFAGCHLGDFAFVQDDPADELRIEMPHVQHAFGRFAPHGEGLRE